MAFHNVYFRVFIRYNKMDFFKSCFNMTFMFRIQKYLAENYDSDSQDCYEQPPFKKSFLLSPAPIVNKEWNMIEKSDRTAKKNLLLVHQHLLHFLMPIKH